MKLALNIITRDTKEDVELLRRLLESTKNHVDGIFITAASKELKGYVKKLCVEYNAHYSEFKWINDFAAARNFNFSQTPEEYDYILWSDVDDVWNGLDRLKLGDKDAYAFWYLYEFDEDNQPTVVHKKTMIVRNDGSFTWKGKIHEDLDANREIDIAFFDDIHRIHKTDELRIEEAKERNLEIAKTTFETDPNDPRNTFNYGNSLIGAGKYSEARVVFEDFLKESGSVEEKYLTLQRLSGIFNYLGEKDLAIEKMLIAIGMQPTYPDAYLQAAQMFYDYGELDEAERYCLQGLTRKPSYNSVIVYNPRDYDYNPMNLLAKIYFRKNRPDLALPCIEGCLKINDNPKMRELAKEMRNELKELEVAVGVIKELEQITDLDDLKKRLDGLPLKYQSHPGVCMLRNKNFIKTESSGKDVTFYCGFTSHEWNPELFRTKGFGGSEEAVVHLSKAFAKKGMNVEVYANIGTQRITEDGVTWKPFWEFNARNKTDYLILWRSPKMCDYDLNAGKIFIDVHDVISPGEFTKKRLAKIDGIFLKTKFHRSLFPNLPDEKCIIIPNGLKIEDFDGEVKKDPMLIINTSSPDRSMEAVVEVFRRVKQKVPEAKLHWAYGWDIFDSAYEKDYKMLEWKKQLVEKIDEVGIVSLGKIPQHKIVDVYKEANIMLYPTEFAEIDCISVKKAQLAGALVISTDFAALDESVQHGVKIHSDKTKEDWCKPYQYQFSVEKEEQIQKFADETIKALKKGLEDRTKAREWAKKFEWQKIAEIWADNLFA